MATTSSALRVVAGYYLATPVFAVADLGFGLPVRVAAVLPDGTRLAYYGAAFALGLLCRARPAATPWVGMMESATNLLLLLLSILLPIWALAADPMLGSAAGVGLTPAGAANAMLSGGAMILSFRRSEAAMLGRAQDGPRRNR